MNAFNCYIQFFTQEDFLNFPYDNCRQLIYVSKRLFKFLSDNKRATKYIEDLELRLIYKIILLKNMCFFVEPFPLFKGPGRAHMDPKNPKKYVKNRLYRCL